MPSRDRAPSRPPRGGRTRLGRRAAAARRLESCPCMLRRSSGRCSSTEANGCGAVYVWCACCQRWCGRRGAVCGRAPACKLT
eukprot:3701927-Prymnesium_polylepis.1